MIKRKKFQCTVHKKRKFWNYFNCSSNNNNRNANSSWSSLNAVIGENGIITQAQNAKIATAVGSFNEYMQSWFFNKKMEDDGYNIEDLYISSGWIERKLDIDDEGNEYYVYIIDKSKVTDKEILKYMQA